MHKCHNYHAIIHKGTRGLAKTNLSYT